MEPSSPSMKKIIKRFNAKFKVVESGCWEWIACSNGYGRFSIFGQSRYAHVVSWLLHKGSWPVKLVCHSCDNPLCVNPQHLFEGTNHENILDASHKGRMTGPKRVLTTQQRDEARQLYRSGLSQRKIARQLSVSQATISECCRYAHEPRRRI